MASKLFTHIILAILLITNSSILYSKSLKIKVGYYDNPPFIFQDKDRTAKGFAVDIINEIAEREDWKLQWNFYPFGEMLENVKRGKCDIGIGAVKTDKRMRFLKYNNEAIFVNWGLILQYKGENISTISDLEGKTFGTIKGSIYTDIIKEMLAGREVNCFIEEVPTNEHLIEQTKRGDINACLIERSVIFDLDSEELIKSTGIVLDPMKHFVVGKLDIDDHILKRIDHHLAKMTQDYQSIYYQSMDKWMGKGRPLKKTGPNDRNINLYIPAIILILILLIISLFLFKKLKDSRKKYEPLIKQSADTVSMLRAMDEEKTNIINCISETVVYIKKDHSIGWINRTGKEVFGLDVKQKLYKNCLHAEAGMRDYCNDCPVKEAIDAGNRVVKEVYFETLRKHFLIDATPLYDGDGNLIGIVEVVSDITLQKIHEKENNKKLELLDLVFQTLPIGLVVVDSHKKIIQVNQHAINLFGFENESEVIGKHDDEILSSQDRTHIEKENDLINGGKRSLNIEREYINNKKKKISVLKTLVPIKLHDEQVYAEVFINITSLKENEKALKAAKDRAEESDVLKSAFLANMSHEIRSPLTAITRLSELLEEDLSVDEKHEFIKLIQDNTNQMLTLINDIIDISKIQSGQLDVLITSVDVVKLASTIYSEFSKTLSVLNKEAVEFIFTPPSETKDIHILADETRLIQILNNLLSNALKFTEEGQVEFGYQVIENKLHFFVKDTGIGISPDKLESIFKPFRQIESSMEKRYEDTGLGLAISKQLAEMMNAEIKVESQEEKGSVFWLELKGDLI